MTTFYSKTTNGFYISDIHELIPEDAIEISEERRVELLDGQARGKQIVAGVDGLPVLMDRAPTDEQRAAIQERTARAYLMNTDWYIVRMHETGKPVPADVLIKRADARELL